MHKFHYICIMKPCVIFAFNANEQPAIKRKCQNIQLPQIIETLLIIVYAITPARAVTPIKKSSVLKGHVFLVLSQTISNELVTNLARLLLYIEDLHAPHTSSIIHQMVRSTISEEQLQAAWSLWFLLGSPGNITYNLFPSIKINDLC